MARSWPLLACIADFTGGPPGLAGGNGVDLLGPATPVGLRQWTTSRGRQYELGTVQAGTMTMDLTDPRELLNPVNSGSAWNSGGKSLLPYRRVQMCALWNTATRDQSGNILNGTNFPAGTFTTGFDPSFESGLGGWFGIAGSPVVATSTAQHFAGAQSMAVTYTGATDVAAVGIYHFPGRQHTLSLYVFVPATHTVTVTWQAPFYGSPTIGTATSSTTGAWQRLTMTATPAGWSSVVSISCTSAYPATVFVDAYQLELGGSASAFTTSGPTIFKLYTGYIERYPQAWDLAGFRGRKPLQAVDALSPLSRTIISQSYASTVLADGPGVYIPYDDDGFPANVQRPNGGQAAISYQQIGTNSSSVTFGGDSFLGGSKAASLVQQNTDPVTTSDSSQLTYLGTRQGVMSMNPSSFTLECWVKFTSGAVYIGAASMGAAESTIGSVAGPSKWVGWYTSGGQLTYAYFDPNGLSDNTKLMNSTTWNGFPDGQWHHLAVILQSPITMIAVVDGVITRTTTAAGSWSTGVSLNNFFTEAQTYFPFPITQISIANVAAYGAILNATQLANHYKRGIGYLGEKSGVRALRLLTQYWSTAVVTDTGLTSMAADFSYNGRGMLDVLQEIADTEAGLVWVDAAGLVHQDSRETRYTTTTSTTPQFVFGENTAGGELPYEVLTYDYDPTYVYSQANITSGGTGTQLTPVVNATSQNAYGQRVLSKTLQTAVDWDAGQAGSFYVQRYAKPAGAPGTTVPPRISGMTINPAANPNLWTAALTLDIGMRVTVKRRTSAGVTISGDYYVEQINHAASGDASTWTVAYQLSPVFVPQAWVLGDATKGVLGTTTACVY